jgi:hypothetical protein
VISGILLLFSLSFAVKMEAGEIEPGEYPAVAVTNHLPEFRNGDAYWDSRQAVVLTVGGQQKFKDLPELAMKQPYTGYIELGDKPQKFGVIVDIVGNEKRFYIDTNGDNSFANEKWYPMLNEWLGLEIFWARCPEPVTVQVTFNTQVEKVFPMELKVEGWLFKPGPFIKGKPSLYITVRTWFLAKLIADGDEKLAAVVDRNNNGRYDDPEDAIIIDYNDDSLFDEKEMAIRTKKGVSIKSGKETRPVVWEAYPDKIMIGGNTR